MLLIIPKSYLTTGAAERELQEHTTSALGLRFCRQQQNNTVRLAVWY